MLPVSPLTERRFETFIMGDNAHLVSSLKELATIHKGINNQMLFIHGSHGLGKTHLLLATCALAEKHKISNQYIDFAELLNFPPEVLEMAISCNLICMDNVDAIAGHRNWEVGVFDFINKCRELGNKTLIFSSSTSVASSQFSLPDLASRLTWGTTFMVQELSEPEKAKTVKLLVKNKGLEISDDVVNYLLKRHARDMNSLVDAIEQLDKASLQDQRKLTIPFVKQTLSL
ncbi:DnaA regulatory inactivator Hda [Glaciecola sp. 1036]|uniref:DnaA regulatory inactivator Hda n=1 Tax=Alteromonadaceae TaxID=72275 RepID=UPI003D04D3F2